MEYNMCTMQCGFPRAVGLQCLTASMIGNDAHLCNTNLVLSVILSLHRIVSATDVRKYDDPPGLQDNAEIVFDALANHSPVFSWMLYGHWANVMHFLGAVLALAFSVAWDQVGSLPWYGEIISSMQPYI